MYMLIKILDVGQIPFYFGFVPCYQYHDRREQARTFMHKFMEPPPASIQVNGQFYTCDKLSSAQWSWKYSRAHTYLEGSEPAMLPCQIKGRFTIALVRLFLWEIGHRSLDDTTTFVILAFPPAVITFYDKNNSTNRTIASNIFEPEN